VRRFLLIVAAFVALVLVMWLFVGPRHSPGRAIAVASETTNLIIDKFGDFPSPDGIWHVSISEVDGTCKIGRRQSVKGQPIPGTSGLLGLTVEGLKTISKDNWRARRGWFVFVENQSRIWCYDGADFLWLIQIDADGSSGSYGPHLFPCPIPPPVDLRLSDSVRKSIGHAEP